MFDTIVHWAGYALPIVIALIAVVLAVLLLWCGLRLLIWPFRIATRRIRAATHAVHPAAYVAAIAIAVIMVPQPFTYVLGVFIDLVRLLAGDLPKLILTAAQGLSMECAGPPATADKCAAALIGVSQSAWSVGIGPAPNGPVGRWIGDLQVPPLWEWGVFTFFACLGAMWLIQRAAAGAQLVDSRDQARTHAILYKTSALVLSLFASLYLCITAIIAIPVFNDRPSDIDTTKKALLDGMQSQPDQYAAQVANVVFIDASLPVTKLLRARVDALWVPDGATAATPTPTSSPNPDGVASGDMLKLYYRNFLNRIIDNLADETATWQRSADELQRAAASFPDRARNFSRRVGDYFAEQNTGRIGGTLTRQHQVILAASYNLWLSAYATGLEGCRSALLVELDAIRARFGAIDQDLATRPAAGPPASAPEGLARPLGGSSDSRGFSKVCANIVPQEIGYLSARRGPSDPLGFFGKAAKWLLATESRDLALITGLLGFGFFGALAASFIRQVAAQPDQMLPPAGWILPALIRGVAAAVLVFLAVVGGLAVFTQAGPEPAPNPYAVFFACFIAAVFSEDVWVWAREHGATGGSSTNNKGASGKAAAATGGPASPPAHPPPEGTRI